MMELTGISVAAIQKLLDQLLAKKYVERGEKETFRLSVRNYVSLATYILAAALGGFCPVAAFIIVAAVTCWWIVPEKRS